MTPVLSEETLKVIEAMDEATWDAVEGYRRTGLPVPIWDYNQNKVVFLSVDEALRRRTDYDKRMSMRAEKETISAI